MRRKICIVVVLLFTVSLLAVPAYAEEYSSETENSHIWYFSYGSVHYSSSGAGSYMPSASDGIGFTMGVDLGNCWDYDYVELYVTFPADYVTSISCENCPVDVSYVGSGTGWYQTFIRVDCRASHPGYLTIQGYFSDNRSVSVSELTCLTVSDDELVSTSDKLDAILVAVQQVASTNANILKIIGAQLDQIDADIIDFHNVVVDWFSTLNANMVNGFTSAVTQLKNIFVKVANIETFLKSESEESQQYDDEMAARDEQLNGMQDVMDSVTVPQDVDVRNSEVSSGDVTIIISDVGLEYAMTSTYIYPLFIMSLTFCIVSYILFGKKG